MREDLIQSAVSFLTDPKVQSAALTKKVSFLESKGMTSEEIEEAMSRANGKAPAATTTATAAAPVATQQPGGAVVPYNTAVATQPPPVPARPSYDWRDVFIAAVLAGGATYGLWTLAKRFFGPWFKVPQKEELEKEKAALDSQFEAVEASLKEIKDQTEEALTAVSTQSDRVNTSITSLEAALKDLKEGDEARQKQFGEVKDEVDALKELVPKMMDRNKQQQGDVLEELQNELKSLKSLLLSRRPTTPSSPVPEPTTSSNTVASATKPVENGNGNGSSIPAWQMAAAASSINNNNNKAPAPSATTPQAEPATGSSSSSAAGSATNNTA
ncbi:hypothetical protein O0I10_003619 [Lichtheimia ornata]|uniref:Peroxisomal membrane protein PEX14 n=1 Tax=Lichtheimia ornata TaxID=688661 RepID=A0AAD7V9W0_9FUNG|nr:uncharacterized protein O0I10_003619 [Lichtheimia ornata]KAJ8660572.1 hypothetical protein O0I10_003619 [Lichtheimia ornata]